MNEKQLKKKTLPLYGACQIDKKESTLMFLMNKVQQKRKKKISSHKSTPRIFKDKERDDDPGKGGVNDLHTRGLL